jgi:murein L,D-transpeptidase YcbB/YkuD
MIDQLRRTTALYATVLVLALAPAVSAEDRTPLPDLAAGIERALAEYRTIEKDGGWEPVDRGPALRPGMEDPRILQLRSRLLASGDLRRDPTDAESAFFDARLAAALERFQRRHGLTTEKGLDADTVTELNVPVKKRIAQLVRNLERGRKFTDRTGNRYIFVNVPDNHLKVVEGGRTLHTARVIVGEAYFQTPELSSVITHMEINPYWNVPQSIATRLLLPKIKESTKFLKDDGYLLLTKFGDNQSAIDPATVKWEQITAKTFRYQLRQKPGPRNALGRIIFRFSNGHNVFLHDTANPDIFDDDDRYYSSGCVRVESALFLALSLLRNQDDGSWTERRIKMKIDEGATFRIDFKKPIPIHLAYFTGWRDSEGVVQFRRDVYQRDVRPMEAGTLPRASRN